MEKESALVWDENKRQKVLSERGVDFADAAELFADPDVAVFADDKKDYGEVRMNAYGYVAGFRMRVCFTLRDDNIRIITMFKVKQKEWNKYYEKND